MKILEYIGEVTKPVGAIYLRFKVRMGDVPPNASREEKRKSLYLTAFTGFANDPKELTAANARLRFMKLNSMNDIVKMIKEIMGDKTFISAKSMTIYMDLPDSAFNTFPYLRGFMDWVFKNGGDRIKVEFKPEGEGEEDPLKKKRKPNPNAGLKQVDYDPADPRYTIHFTVSDRFYDAIRKSMPNLMQYKGSGQDFRMPKELFDKFRDAAKQRYGDIGLKIIKKAHTDESLEEGANTLFAVKVVDPKTGNEKTIEISALTAAEAKSKVAGKWVEVDGEKKHYKVVSVKSAWDDSVDEGFGKAAWELGKGAVKVPAKAIGRAVGGAAGGVTKGVGQVAGGALKGVGSTLQGKPFTGIGQAVKGAAVGSAQAVGGAFKGLGKATVGLGKDIKDVASDVRRGWAHEDITDEGGPASRALCKKAAKGKPIGNSAKSSCVSQGLLPHHSGRKDYVNGKQLPVDGKYIAGKKHGGPLPNYSKKKK